MWCVVGDDETLLISIGLRVISIAFVALCGPSQFKVSLSLPPQMFEGVDALLAVTDFPLPLPPFSGIANAAL